MEVKMSKSILSIIENCPLEIKQYLIMQNFKKGTNILEQDYAVKYVHILLKGKNKVYKTSKSGLNYLEIVLEEGGVYGEAELLDNKPSMCTVEALTDCEVLKLSKEVYKNWLKLDNDFSMFIIETLSNKLYFKIEKSANDIFCSLEHRLLNLILTLHNDHKSTNIFIYKNLLAEELATSIRSINRILHKLEEKSILKYKNGQIIILDLDKLKNEKGRLEE